MSEIKIIKAKLLKGDKVEIDFTQKSNSEEKPANCSLEQEGAPRKELRNAMAALAPHAALFCEFVPKPKSKKFDDVDPELFNDFSVSGFTIVSNKNGDEGVILTARKTLSTGITFGWNTPTIPFDSEEDASYPFGQELSDAIDVCLDEFREYINGVRAEDPQLKMELQD